MIIGITSTTGAGKDTAAEFFVKQGFIHYSLSEIIRDELRKENALLTRENQIEKGNRLRRQYGNNVLAVRTLEKIEKGKNYVITSIRNRAEIEELKKSGNDFFLISLDAEPLLRFQRAQSRISSTIDPVDFNVFLENDRRESISEDGSGQEISKCQEIAEITIENNETIQELHNKLNETLSSLKSRLTYKRPNWDEYFLAIMEEIGKRATCDRGRSGSLIVKNKRILTTGYVGSPPGIKHCDEIGHLMIDVINEDNTISKHCIRTTHAEQNAIIQAARFGIPIEGSTIYCKMEPCHVCAKMIISSGVNRVVCKKRYHAAQITRELFKEAGIQLDVIQDEIEEYKNQ